MESKAIMVKMDNIYKCNGMKIEDFEAGATENFSKELRKHSGIQKWKSVTTYSGAVRVK